MNAKLSVLQRTPIRTGVSISLATAKTSSAFCSSRTSGPSQRMHHRKQPRWGNKRDGARNTGETLPEETCPSFSIPIVSAGLLRSRLGGYPTLQLFSLSTLSSSQQFWQSASVVQRAWRHEDGRHANRDDSSASVDEGSSSTTLDKMTVPDPERQQALKNDGNAESEGVSSWSSSPSSSAASHSSMNREETLSSCKERSPEEVEGLFFASVKARTVSNAQLRRFIQQLTPGQHALAIAAVQGSRRAGLRLNALTHEVLLESLIASGQLKASMALHQEMMRSHMVPTARTYALLMELCLERGLSTSCETLFEDMHKKGMRPSMRNYELLIAAYAEHDPPQWEKAIALFDSVSRQRYLRPTAKTYNALMRVYLNMRPFDWRVVYNCYYELRHHDPPITLEWESYELVREALVKGHAGWFRRISTFCDAWLTTTPMFTVRWMQGVMVYLVIMVIFKSILSTLITALFTATESQAKSTADAIVV